MQGRLFVGFFVEGFGEVSVPALSRLASRSVPAWHESAGIPRSRVIDGPLAVSEQAQGRRCKSPLSLLTFGVSSLASDARTQSARACHSTHPPGDIERFCYERGRRLTAVVGQRPACFAPAIWE